VEVDLHRLEAVGDLVVLLGLLRLPLERADRLLDLLHDVVHAGEVLLDLVQLPHRGLPADLVLRHPGGLLEELAPLVVAVAQDGLDHLQLDDRVGVAPHPGVHEEVLDVLQPAGDLVEEVFALPGPEDAPADGHLGILARQDVLRVLDREGDFGEPQGAPVLRPVEDHVLHLVGTQRAVALFAQRPADGVDDVGLAAPVGADDRGEPRVEVQVRPLGERLEADDFDL
jgi:hypothetical protein